MKLTRASSEYPTGRRHLKDVKQELSELLCDLVQWLTEQGVQLVRDPQGEVSVDHSEFAQS